MYHTLEQLNNDITVLSNNALLDEIFAALKDSQLAEYLVEGILTNAEFFQVAVESTVSLLNANLVPMSDIVTVVLDSDMVYQFINEGLEDSDTRNGLLDIISNVVDATFNSTAITSVSGTQDEGKTQYQKRDLELIREILAALYDSGLLESLIKHLLISPHLRKPASKFFMALIRTKAIKLKEVFECIKSSVHLLKLIRAIVAKKELLAQVLELIKRKLVDGILKPTDLAPIILREETNSTVYW